jgi:UPF0755 protein
VSIRLDDDRSVDDGFDPLHAHRRVQRSRRRRTVVLLVLLVVVPLAVVLGAGGWFWWQLDPPGDPGARVRVEVTKGWGVPEIAEELTNRDVIGSSFVFETYSRLKGAGPFQAGTYTLREHMGVRGAIDVLEKGPVVSGQKLAIIPGQRLGEIASAVEKQVPWLDAAKFLRVAQSGAVRSKFEPAGSDNLEGLLWPDTYQIGKGENETDVLRTMVRQFDKEATAAGLRPTTDVEGHSAYDVVTVASLIQSEAKLERDRPLIASVVYNRLRADMPLGIDAAVMYGAGTRSPLTREQLDTPGPYNTYLNKGLTPTPISGVTTASLRAALHPAQSDFLYYVIGDADGGHVFAKTYEEHLQNVEAARAKGLL